MKFALLAAALIATPVWAQTPPSTLAASCPEVAEQLSELLASAKQRVGREGQVVLAFDVDARGRPQLVSVAGERAYRGAVRSALPALECQAGTPQRYVLTIQFADPAPRAATALAQASTPAR